MERNEIRAALDAAAPAGDPQRIHDITAKCGQLFGWITQPDTFFLVDWLPVMSAEYPRQPMRIVEVGSFAGSTARGLVALTGGGETTCIDDFRDMNAGTLNGHPNGRSYWEATVGGKYGPPSFLGYARLVEGRSADIGRGWSSPIDLLFIDGDHSYAGALSDMTLFASHVVPGGYCMVDDFHMPDVARAVGDYFRGAAWELVRMPTVAPASIVVFRRRDA